MSAGFTVHLDNGEKTAFGDEHRFAIDEHNNLHVGTTGGFQVALYGAGRWNYIEPTQEPQPAPVAELTLFPGGKS